MTQNGQKFVEVSDYTGFPRKEIWFQGHKEFMWCHNVNVKSFEIKKRGLWARNKHIKINLNK